MNTVATLSEHRPAHHAPRAVPRRAVAPMNFAGCLSDLLRVLGVPAEQRAGTPDVPLAVWRVSAGAALWHEGSLATSLCIVHTGTFKRSKMSTDGYEQVLSFLGQGELLGFEGYAQGTQPFAVTALESSSVFAVPMRELELLRRRYPVLDHALMRAVSENLARAGEVAELMAAVMAEVRLARFLIWQSDRMVARGQSAHQLLLRMGRRDIASLLGVAHETVSRSFTLLAQAGLIAVSNRSIEVLDRPALQAFAQATRGPHEGGRPASRHGTDASAADGARVCH
jgi:CRP/FNR family transcriptional regulator